VLSIWKKSDVGMDILTPTQEVINVGMGQVYIGRSPMKLTAVLGSCLGICLYHPKSRTGGLAHAVLPQSNGQPVQSPGKFVDSAIRYLMEIFRNSLGIPPNEVQAKLTGGACMFPTTGPLQIGDANIQEALRKLQELEIPVISQDVGGTKGRRITFDLASGQVVVQQVGEVPRIL
jgi:Chemotaxis protein; stimulates methylation of MCP proteins